MKNYIYVHGGKSNGYHSDMYKYHIVKKKWYSVGYKDKAPLARYGHALLYWNGSLYMVGGYDQHGFCCDDLYQFTPETHSWRKIQFISPLGAITIGRFHSAAVIYKSKILIYAGKGSDAIRNDLLEYDLSNHTWKRVITAKGSPEEPPGRWGHSCNVIGDHLYIFGGRDAIMQFNELYCFDLVNLKWKQLLPSQKTSPGSGYIPEPRYFHAGVNCDNSLFIVWGKNIYDFNFDDIIEWRINKPPASSSCSSSNTTQDGTTSLAVNGLSNATTTANTKDGSKDEIRSSVKSQGSDSSFSMLTIGSNGVTSPSAGSRLSGERRMRLKCVYKEEMRIISVPPVIGYHELVDKLVSEYGEEDLKIQYEDDEGDLITIRSAADVEEAFVFFGDAHRPSVRLLLSSTSSHGPPSSLSSLPQSFISTSPQQQRESRPIRPSKDSFPFNSQQQQQPLSSSSSPQLHAGGGGGVNSPSVPSLPKISSGRRDSVGSLASPTSAQRLSASASKRIVKWQSGGIIGEGGFGKVYLGMNSETGELMAVKQVPLGNESNQQVDSLRREIALIQDLHHQNIVRYFGSEAKDGFLNIFLEYQPGGSIASLLLKFHTLSERIIRSFTKQTLLGLDYLHSHSIAHRDIKGANLLVDLNGCVKLADFGASKQLADMRSFSEGCKTVTGSPYWMAPEVIQGNAGGRSYGRKADIWSLGAVVVEMATGKPPFCNLAPVTALFRIGSSSAIPDIPSSLSPAGKDFLSQCFRRDVSKRPTAAELLQHPWIAELDESSSPTISATFDTKTLAFQHDTLEDTPKVHVIEAPIPGPLPKNPKSSKKTSSSSSSSIITKDMKNIQLDTQGEVISPSENSIHKRKTPRNSPPGRGGSSSSSRSELDASQHHSIVSMAISSTAGLSDEEDDDFGSIIDFVSSRAGDKLSPSASPSDL